MPTYVYECRKCEQRFEKVQRMTEKPLRRCEMDGCVGSVFRVIQPVGIQFKGSGFHINDYGSSGPKGRNGKPSSETLEKAKDDTKTSDTKPEKKSETKPDKKKSEAAA